MGPHETRNDVEDRTSARIAALEAEIATLKRERDKWRKFAEDDGQKDVRYFSKAMRYQRQLAEFKQKAAEVVGPFGDMAGEVWADENGWTAAACQNDRICDWFGPTDFRRARTFLATLQTKDDTHA